MSEPRIVVLPSEVAEKIAAGEVIERPASVVKELIENALDAGAGRVTIETEAGGKALIRVTDDGDGMTAEEAPLAVQPHATSKLRTADDLFAIHTLGFRGEALPSVAAISRFELVTRPNPGFQPGHLPTPARARARNRSLSEEVPALEAGYEVEKSKTEHEHEHEHEQEHEATLVRIEGGRLLGIDAVAAPPGTSVAARDLFFNVPARQKFLRSDNAEAGHITELVQRLALSHAGVTFRLLHDGREALLSPGSEDPLNAIVAVLGRPIARELLRIPEYQGDRMTVTGFAGRPTLTRSNRSNQLLYVNGRTVRSPLFYRALDEAYRATMPSGRYPVAVVFLQVPSTHVDVNVHPSKLEVRFRDDYGIYLALLTALQAALRPATEHAGSQESFDPEDPFAGVPSYPPQTVREAPTTYGTAAPPPPTEPRSFWPRPEDVPVEGQESGSGTLAPGDTETDRTLITEHQTPFSDSALGRGGWSSGWRPTRPSLGPRPPADHGDAPGNGPAPSQYPTPNTQHPNLSALRPLGQARDLFLIAEGGGRLWVLDQHVAHERILFDRLTDPNRPEAEPAEPLLIPLTLQLDSRQALVLEEYRTALGEMGYEIEPFGKDSFVVRAIPRSLLGRNYEQALRDTVDELTELSQGGRVQLRREQLAMAAAGRACKAAMKAGQPLSLEEMQRLITDLAASRNPFTCPHGRPVFLTFAPEEIARLFGEGSCE
jgi:DNA mismatch repair protein MutL